jgi:hypothetical protein
VVDDAVRRRLDLVQAALEGRCHSVVAMVLVTAEGCWCAGC